MKLKILNEIPPGLLSLSAPRLHRMLSGPTLIQLTGRRQQPLFVSVLQHGNETSGWDALRELLAGHTSGLPRSLWIFIANVEAAQYGRRRLDYQPDFNRCWPGGEAAGSHIHRLLADLTDRVRATSPFASIDLHNNSGRNPHYAATTRLDPAWLHLASQFADRAVYFRLPSGVQSDAFSRFCPAITIECGQVGASGAVTRCRDFLEYCLHLSALPETQPTELQLYRTVARLTLGPEISVGIGASCAADICLEPELEQLNFSDLSPGVCLGQLRATDTPRPISALDDHNNDVTDHYLKFCNNRIETGQALTPSMLTLDPVIARQDCLGYLMKRVPLPQRADG